MRRVVFTALLGFVLSLSVFADEVAFIQYQDRFHPVLGQGGMVVSQEALASRVGADILAAGGNAVDAAVATGFALAVTLPQAGNLGGGGFMLVHLAETGKTIAIDYREMAPARAHRDMFLDNDGNVDAQQARFSALSTGVPGTVAGLIHAQQHYGSLPLKRVLAPAITLAEKGFSVGYPLSYSLQRAQPRLSQQSAARAYFLTDEGSALPPGHRWVQKDLAATLKRIARHGADDFYRGRTADLIVAEMERSGGLISHDDLANYQVVEREPVVGSYRGLEVISMPPPSSGGIHLVQMLNILEGWDLAAEGHNSAGYLHRLIEAMRRAYADRSKYLGDPDFVQVPVAELIDKAYAERLRDGIDLERATPSSEVAPALKPIAESPQTTHYSVWDEAGNVVTNTYTLNFSYGNGIAVSGAGFLLNNEMDDFSSKPGAPNAFGLLGDEANAIEPGKRPLSSMTPTLVLRDGVPVLVTGGPGGSRIITSVLQVILNHVDFGMNVAEATAAPRIHHQWFPDAVDVEPGISPDTINLLRAKGHDTRISGWAIGRTQSITRQQGLFQGMTDYRWPGGSAEPAR
ncbi:MAG: gamma-glutamyltransferase [Porticoccaceae bacterium]|nr:gamma-glutamyltransferase [Porticoccaceae bacterium]